MSQTFNYRHLYYFWIVAKEGGMARAAERLDMALPTISTQVRELEKSLGVSLLKPQGRNLVLTEAGVAAMHEADQIFALGENLPHKVQQAVSGANVRFNVGISDGVAKLAVHRMLAPVLSLAIGRMRQAQIFRVVLPISLCYCLRVTPPCACASISG